MTQADVDAALRSLLVAVEGRRREPVGRSVHIHQLDGARLEAMVYIEPGGVRIDWSHGKGDCAITGEGGAILSALRGDAAVDPGATDGRLVLYGDMELVRSAPAIFAPRRRSAGR